MKQHTYKIDGMHCASCELLIEDKLANLPGIESVQASSKKGEVTVNFKDNPLSNDKINSLINELGYCVCETQNLSGSAAKSGNELFTSLGIAVVVFLVFLSLNRMGLSGIVNVSASSSLPAFFFFGLLAGVSTCAALTGGIVLSMSQTWQQGYAKNDTLTEKMKPHLLFNIGRISAYALFGAILGTIGSKLQLSFTFNALLVIAVSVFMILTGFKMFGVKALRGFQIALPKSLTRKASNQQNIQGKYMPTIMGALTVFLPCGFTITTISLALLSGNLIQGALIMAVFALGTAPGLLAIGFSSVKMGDSKKSVMFSKAAGALILLFAVFNINSQLNVLGLPSFNNLTIKANANEPGISGSPAADGLAPVENGKQILRMQANSSGYTPNYFKVIAGIPVVWEITDTGTSGCTNAVISNSLFEGNIPLTPGQISIKEFTPTKAGRYKFSCWMGMVTGVIEVVDAGSTAPAAASNTEIPSGAKGCGCGGGK